MSHIRYTTSGQEYRTYIVEGPADAGDLSTWSWDVIVKRIVGDNLGPDAARRLAERWALAAGLAPASAQLQREVAAILLAADELRREELKKTFRKPDAVPVDPASELFDRRVRDYARRNFVSYAEAFTEVGKREPELAKKYTEVGGEEMTR